MSHTIAANPIPSKGQADRDPYAIPLAAIDVSDSELFETDTQAGYFARLRHEDPVHFCPASAFGPYWSITKYADVMTVERDAATYSSERSIVIGDLPDDFALSPGFIAMDDPRHTAHRKTISPVLGPRNLVRLEGLIRQRAVAILDSLPVGEVFDWVDAVSIELTTAMLATLFDFPYDERRRLTYWSDMATASPGLVGATGATEEERRAALEECLEVFQGLWKERVGRDVDRLDFVTALANGPATQEMSPIEILGTLILLIVGGNDTTRNSISGGVLALNENPAEYDKLRQNAGLIPNMVCEMIRWQTPLAHMRRTATCDTELGGKRIAQGDKVVMWYVSANRDDTAIPRANEFLIDRADAREHLSFGWGIHFCVGSRLAEMQLRILWEEILQRFRHVEVVGTPVRVRSNFVRGFHTLPVRLHPL